MDVSRVCTHTHTHTHITASYSPAGEIGNKWVENGKACSKAPKQKTSIHSLSLSRERSGRSIFEKGGARYACEHSTGAGYF